MVCLPTGETHYCIPISPVEVVAPESDAPKAEISAKFLILQVRTLPPEQAVTSESPPPDAAATAGGSGTGVGTGVGEQNRSWDRGRGKKFST